MESLSAESLVWDKQHDLGGVAWEWMNTRRKAMNGLLACLLALPLLPRQDSDEGGGGPAVGPIEFDHL